MTSVAYDKDNRPTLTTEAVGTSLQRSETTGYDPVGNVTARADGLGHTVTSVFDGLDRRTELHDALNHVWTYGYDKVGNTTSVKDPLGKTLTYAYDAADRLTQRQDSLGGTLTSDYDAAGRLTSRQLGGAGQTPVRLDQTWTARDQLATVTRYSDLAGTQTVGSSAYTYDAAEGD